MTLSACIYVSLPSFRCPDKDVIQDFNSTHTAAPTATANLIWIILLSFNLTDLNSLRLMPYNIKTHRLVFDDIIADLLDDIHTFLIQISADENLTVSVVDHAWQSEATVFASFRRHDSSRISVVSAFFTKTWLTFRTMLVRMSLSAMFSSDDFEESWHVWEASAENDGCHFGDTEICQYLYMKVFLERKSTYDHNHTGATKYVKSSNSNGGSADTSRNTELTTASIPVAKTAEMPIFRLVSRCRFQTMYIGMTNMLRSLITFIAPVVTRRTHISMQ